MAEHLHEQIAKAVRDILDGSAVSLLNGRAFAYQVYPTDLDQLPYGCAWVPREEVQRESGDGDSETLIEAIAELRVAIFVDGEEAEIEGLLNQGLVQTQVALAGGLQLASGEVDLDYRGCDKTYERGDLPYGQLLMRFDAEIAYLRNDPTRLAWQ